MHEITWKGKRRTVEARRFGNGRICLVLMPGEHRVSVNVPEIPLAGNETFIKDYSENTGVLDALIQGGIVSPIGETVPSGFVTLPLVTILPEDLLA